MFGVLNDLPVLRLPVSVKRSSALSITVPLEKAASIRYCKFAMRILRSKSNSKHSQLSNANSKLMSITRLYMGFPSAATQATKAVMKALYRIERQALKAHGPPTHQSRRCPQRE